MLPREYPNLYIDGRWQDPDSDERIDVISPSTGEKIGYVPSGSTTDMDRAVEAARKAFYETDWAQRPVEERAEMCERLAALIAEHREEFRDLIVDELGHTKFLADVYHSVAPTLHWNYYAKLGRNFKFAEVREADLSAAGRQRGRADHEVRDQEPGACASRSASSPCCARSTSRCRASPRRRRRRWSPAAPPWSRCPTPTRWRSSRWPTSSREAGFPPGVLNIVAAEREASAHLVSHPDVDMVTFTGSTEVGKKIAATCAEQVKPVRARARRQVGGDHPRRTPTSTPSLPTVVGVSAGTSQGESCVCMSRILAPRVALRRDRGRR